MTFLSRIIFPAALIALVTAPTLQAAVTTEITPADYPGRLLAITSGRSGSSASIPLLSGFGPIFRDGSGLRYPGDYRVRLLSDLKSVDGSGRTLRYQASDVAGEPVFSITLADFPDGGGMSLTLAGESGDFAGVHPGRLPAQDGLAGFNLPTRHTEDHPGHGRFPNTFYHRKAGVWIRGDWDLDYSNASLSRELYPTGVSALEGEDAVFFPGLGVEGKASPDSTRITDYYLGTALLYQTGQDGKRKPLQERFRLYWGEHLWAAVEKPDLKPSPYREVMRDLLYVDIWDGHYPDRSAFTAWMQETVGKYVGGLCIVQNWQGGGFDSSLPESISDALPPSQGKAGTPEQLKVWMEQMKSWGLAGLRTNYQLYRDKGAPLPQTVARSLDEKGKPKWHTQVQSVLEVITRQENYIRDHYATTASFSDQLTSVGHGWPYVDFTPGNPDAGTIRGARAGLRAQAHRIKEIVKGPLLSETLNTQFLIGEYVDTGDYGIFEGFNRLFTPEFKLRRLHGLSVFHGMGLSYRYFYGPPYGGTDRQPRGFAMYAAAWGPGSDDYRAMTIAYGNAAYLDYGPQRVTYDKALTEAMTVGVLQRYYLYQPVSEISYETPDGWETLEAILLAGHDPRPFFARIKVVYANGLVVVVNRKNEPLAWRLPSFGDVLLPRYSYAVYSDDGAVEGFSGIPAGTGDSSLRIDYTSDRNRNLLFINPRATGWRDLPAATIFENGDTVYQLPKKRRYRPHVTNGADWTLDDFSGALRWSPMGNRKARIVEEGDDLFVRIESDDRPSRLDRQIGRRMAGTVKLRYRTEAEATVASVSLMRFGRVDGSMREITGRKTVALPGTSGEWREGEVPFRFPEDGALHVVLRLAAADPEAAGAGVVRKAATLDVESVRIVEGENRP
ncbi:hypothetical protein OPIT5_15165 [Opitutaceae bacterium TAV5]|nr:hypothetical protein OPIT5_15165 [Opitutaceae bacterium TAV5]